MITHRTWVTACADHPGGREEQQDRVAVFMAEDCVLAVLADGLGGHRGGAAAAQAVVDCARTAFDGTSHPVAGVPEFLERIRRDAHAAINGLAAGMGEQPHATCVLFYTDGERADWVHAGDSRLYRAREGKAEAMTRDHSYAQVLVDQGRLAAEAVTSHPAQGQLLVALGGAEDQGGELGGAFLRPGDGWCLCSDGVWETLSPDEIAQALGEADLASSARALVETAIRRGGSDGDNVSLALLRGADGSSPPPRPSWFRRLIGGTS